MFFELELAKHFKFLKLNFNHILPIAVLKSSVTAAKRKLENSREKIYMWQESREEIPGQFNRKIVVLRLGENFGEMKRVLQKLPEHFVGLKLSQNLENSQKKKMFNFPVTRKHILIWLQFSHVFGLRFSYT